MIVPFRTLFVFVVAVLMLSACKDSYNGPGPREPKCVEFAMQDTVENMRGVVKLVDTLVYIANYVDQATTLDYYPCAIAPAYVKQGFPLEYSGYLRKRDGDKRTYIELTTAVPILNETVITNYKGFVRFRDSASIPLNERNGAILDSKVENYKLKLLINYTGCTRGRTAYLTLYKTTQSSGVTTVNGFVTSPYEPCSTAYTLWYEIDVSDYKETVMKIFDGVKTHTITVPK